MSFIEQRDQPKRNAAGPFHNRNSNGNADANADSRHGCQSMTATIAKTIKKKLKKMLPTTTAAKPTHLFILFHYGAELIENGMK